MISTTAIYKYMDDEEEREEEEKNSDFSLVIFNFF